MIQSVLITGGSDKLPMVFFGTILLDIPHLHHVIWSHDSGAVK